MALGTVKWYNPTKGFGFIEPQEGGDDAFVHRSAVDDALKLDSNFGTLNEGEKVEYELITDDRGKKTAGKLKKVA